ncbi:MAG: ExeM/NucH family extracellular endonuclease, partial [Ilumatobacteraceae bacterium]
IDNLNRPALIQTFEEVRTGERVTVAVNHLKSKGSSCAAIGDPDRLDGQGNCPGTRTNAAAALADYLATDPTGSGDPDFLILGDLNAYRREDPITTLTSAGYTDLIEEFVGDEAYSFLFDGQLGYLDHALATPSLVGQVTGVTEWAINADEPPLFDYNDTVLDPGEASFERESAARELYRPDPRRSSDHNPLVVGLDLDGVPNTLTVDSALIVTRAGGGRLVLSATVAGATFRTCPEVVLAVEGVDVVRVQTTAVGQTNRCQAIVPGGTVVTFDRATGALRVVAPLPAGFVLTDDAVTFDLDLGDEQFTTEVTGRRVGPTWTY